MIGSFSGDESWKEKAAKRKRFSPHLHFLPLLRIRPAQHLTLDRKEKHRHQDENGNEATTSWSLATGSKGFMLGNS